MSAKTELANQEILAVLKRYDLNFVYRIDGRNLFLALVDPEEGVGEPMFQFPFNIQDHLKLDNNE